MTFQVVLRYLVGSRDAILSVARSSASLPLGVALVLLTAVARNYDQTFALETPLWLFGPLLFSLFSGTWLFFVLYRLFIKRYLAPEIISSAFSQWRSFMGLFWMTAPIAWLYAIPVERFLDRSAAARANITLLAIVSLWRVVLMSRVVSVVNGVSWLRSLAWVLLGASLEVMVVAVGGTAGGDFSNRILASMAGMRNAPDESLLFSAMEFAQWGAKWAFVTTTILLLVFRYRGAASPFPRVEPDRVPWTALGVAAAVWALIAWPSQMEQRRFVHHARLLLSEGNYSAALAYVSEYEQRDFPAGRRLEPNPFEYHVWKDLPPTIALMTTDTPDWIRRTYLSHLSSTFVHDVSIYPSAPDVAAMYASIAKLPEGREWMRTNEAALVTQGIRIGRLEDDDGEGDYDDDDAEDDAEEGDDDYRGGDYEPPHEEEAQDDAAVVSILASLRALGMAETNLAGLMNRHRQLGAVDPEDLLADQLP